MRRLSERIILEKDAVMQWHTQAGNITTNIRGKVDFTLTTLSTTDVVIWKCHLNESARVRYDTILVRYLLTEVVLNIKCSE